ncbi:MAG: amino acid racemase [Tissierellia bacterium]|nr:amino acid racemase [Tissierellia bacterium]
MDYELGIIGGMGPLATSVFFEYLVKHTRAHRDQDHINSIVLNHTFLPDRSQVIKEGKEEVFLDRIKEDFDLLNGLDLKAIAIPCNTSHYFFDQVQAMSRAPIINMVEETLAYAKALGARQVTVLASDGTAQSGIYKTYGQALGLEVRMPEAREQKLVMDRIYQVKEEGKTFFADINDLIDRYQVDSEVILACTELSAMEIGNRPVIDALKVLGNQAIKACGREIVE